jgi:hypothetical protein
MHLFLPTEKREYAETSPYSSTKTDIHTAAPNVSPSSAKSAHRGIIGLPPLPIPELSNNVNRLSGKSIQNSPNRISQL